MQYLIDSDLRNALLEHLELGEAIREVDGINLPNEEYILASMLRDLKPLREVDAASRREEVIVEKDKLPRHKWRAT